MGLITHDDGPARPDGPERPGVGYEVMPLLIPGAAGDAEGGKVAVLRRRTARQSKRAVVYVHCLGDAFVPSDLVGWYTDRGFHFYAADLRAVGNGGSAPADGNRAAWQLGACFACLDAAVTHLRAADDIRTVVVSAHAAGALIAALWCHARRGSRPADALILAGPELGTRRAWPARVAAREDGVRPSPLLSGAQRRLRRGLDITCPVLVMSPAGHGRPGGSRGPLPLAALGTLGIRPGRRATIRLGEHVTWLTLDSGLPGQQVAAGPQRRFLDEIGRWLSAYLSGQIRDQLL
jgi:Serine aminopeptidase, S33